MQEHARASSHAQIAQCATSTKPSGLISATGASVKMVAEGRLSSMRTPTLFTSFPPSHDTSLGQLSSLGNYSHTSECTRNRHCSQAQPVPSGSAPRHRHHTQLFGTRIGTLPTSLDPAGELYRGMLRLCLTNDSTILRAFMHDRHGSQSHFWERLDWGKFSQKMSFIGRDHKNCVLSA